MHKLTIIIPCYNCEKTLEEAVNSCKRQNITVPFEIVMVDDKSTDNTISIIKKLCEEDSALKYFSHDKNLGGGATRNTAVKNSTGDIIFCLDSDDILPDNIIPKMLNLMLSQSSDGVFFEYTKFFSGTPNNKNEIVRNNVLDRPVSLSDMFEPNAGFLARVNFLYTKEAFNIIGGYPTHHGFDTQTFGFLFLSKGLKSYVCPDTFYLHRRNESPSYFDREYRTGRLSYNTYLMYEDIFFLLSDKSKEVILNFDIFNRNVLGRDNLEKTITGLFLDLKEANFFVKDYKNYINPIGETEYIRSINDSIKPLDIVTKAIYEYKNKNYKDASSLFARAITDLSASLLLRLNIVRCGLAEASIEKADTVAYQEFNKKKVTFLMHNGGRLGNQLWTIAALYAYSIEKGYTFDIRCFFEYQQFFNVPIKSILAKITGTLYTICEKTLRIPENLRRDLFYSVFTIWSESFSLIKGKSVVFDSDLKEQATLKIFVYKRYKTISRIFANTLNMILGRKPVPPYVYATKQTPVMLNLPPSSKTDVFPLNKKTAYFYGWLFRNQDGILKYQKEIRRFLAPKKEYLSKIEGQINSARESFKNLVGVHVRLGDVVNEFMDSDRIAYSENEVLNILKDYLDKSNLKPEDTCFFICSDGSIEKTKFVGLNLIITKNNPAEDMWLLSMTDTIIGADSSFAIMASLLGNKPFIVFKRSPLDWEYYKDKNAFFINKYVKRFIY